MPTSKTINSKYELLDNWANLANALNLKTNVLSHALVGKDKLQRKLRIGKRTVYQSLSSLARVQQRLNLLLTDIFDTLPDNEVAIAYRKGKTIKGEVERFTGTKRLVKTDISKYYDNISLAHIEKCLARCGFNNTGARLVGRYLVVWNGRFSSLQQGSAASPAMANIVGHFCFDEPILAWLKEQGWEDVHYRRYSDNLALFIMKEPPCGYTKASEMFKAFVKGLAKEHKFHTHSWSSISNNHRKRHQEFLGCVINKVFNIEKAKRRRYMGTIMKTMLLDNPSEGMLRYFKMEGNKMPIDVLFEKFMQSMEGYCNYMGQVNGISALRMEKLLRAFKMVVPKKPGFKLTDSMVHEITRYRDNNETLEAYETRVAQAIG